MEIGTAGAGPGTVTVNKTDTVTNTISGSYTSTGDISASLGVTIGKSQSYSVRYSLPVPSGKTYQIKYGLLFVVFCYIMTSAICIKYLKGDYNTVALCISLID